MALTMAPSSSRRAATALLSWPCQLDGQEQPEAPHLGHPRERLERARAGERRPARHGPGRPPPPSRPARPGRRRSRAAGRRRSWRGRRARTRPPPRPWPSRHRSGTPLPSALAMVTTSGTTPRRWWANHAPQRPSPVCTSSTMKSTPRSSQSRRTPWKYSARGRVHPALALHRLEEHGRDRRRQRRLELVEVEPGDVAEALRERLERLVLGRLTGGVQRGQRAAVEGAVGADHLVPAASAEAPGQLQRALVGLGTRSWRRTPGRAARRRRASRAAPRRGGGRGSGPPASPARCRRGSRRAAASAPVGGAPRPRRGGCARGSSRRARRGGRGSGGRPCPRARRPRRARAGASAAP